METLAASFLADLDELSEVNQLWTEEDVDDDLENILKLQKSRRYIDMMQKVEDEPKLGGIDDEEQLIVDCHALSVDIENEIVLIHKFIRDKYGLKVAELELESFVDYARAVRQMDVTTSLVGLLPSPIIIVFSSWLLGKTIKACDTAVALDSAKKKLLDFVETRMPYVAPNLSAVVGCAVAVKLMATARSLSSLAKMGVSNILLLGAKKEISSAKIWCLGTYIEQSEIIQTTPPPLAFSFRACGLLAAQSKLAAHMDSTGKYPTGEYGASRRERLRETIEERQNVADRK